MNSVLRGECFGQGLLIPLAQVTTLTGKFNVIYHLALTDDCGEGTKEEGRHTAYTKRNTDNTRNNDIARYRKREQEDTMRIE